MATTSIDEKEINGYPIKTIVVLVQENRSFDHMLGWMKLLKPEIDGVTGLESNPLNTSDPKSARVNFGNDSVHVDPDPGHSIQDVYEQIFGEPWSQESTQKKLPPKMQGFAQNANRIKTQMDETVMNGFKPELVPVYKELVNQFAVCDRWFASIPASTQPNRLYVHSATSHGLSSNDSNKNLRKLKYIPKFHQFDVTFKRHCKEGKLPNYVVIEQRYLDMKLLPGNDDHPSHDISIGQKFIKEVYEALRSSPQWNEMLFVITYDEHGGFFDHVPTPVHGVPSPDDLVGPAPYNFKFDRLGVRVPTIFISPWIKPGTVLHTPKGPQQTSQYEHSSIPATVKKIFNLNNFLTKRDAWAATFEGVLNRTTPRTDCPVTLPEPVKLRDSEAKEDRKLSDFQGEMVQLAACLKGDHMKDTYPNKLVEEMNVAEAAKYCNEALEIFFQECEKAKQNGVDEDTVIVVFGEQWSQVSAQKKKAPTMQGFAQNANRIQSGMDEAVMNGFKPDLVPVYKELVTQFAVCDRWFASVPASTQPNRLYVHSATSHGLTSNDTSKLIGGLPQKTIFESLDEAGFSFGIYYQYPPSTLFYRYFDLLALPGNDDHPSHDVSVGQKFIKEVYEALRSSPQWNEMLFIITYDEHGGFFDHVPTPVEGVPSPDDIVGPEPYDFGFDRLGIRVPSIMISPWIEPGTVIHGPSGPYPTSEYEHSSIPATVKKIFNLKEFLTKRDAWAGTFESVVNRKTPRTDCPETLPEPVKLRATSPLEDRKLSDFQAELVQMAACLKGDHKKKTYPDALVESMTVKEAAEYVQEAWKIFLHECDEAKKRGEDESTIIVVDAERKKTRKSFAGKFCSCLACKN
ncbi:Non-specific phospholipase C3 [Bienertia sinuspersici]